MASFGRVLPAQALFVLLTVMSLRSRASPPLPSTPRLPRLPLSPNAFLRLPSRSRFMYLLPFPSPACLAAFLRVSPRGFYNWPSSSPPSRPFLPYILLFHTSISAPPSLLNFLFPSSSSSLLPPLLSPLPQLPFPSPSAPLPISLLSPSFAFLLPNPFPVSVTPSLLLSLCPPDPWLRPDPARPDPALILLSSIGLFLWQHSGGQISGRACPPPVRAGPLSGYWEIPHAW